MSDPDQTPTAPLRVTLRDLRTARYCRAGVRPWFRRHGLDWQGFLDIGIDAAVLRATGDTLVEPVIAAAEARACREMQDAQEMHGQDVHSVEMHIRQKETTDGRA